MGPGEVGYLITGVKEIDRIRVGDTITSSRRPATEALPARYCELSAEKKGRVTRSRIEREAQETTLSAAVTLARTEPGSVLEWTREAQAQSTRVT